MKTLKDLLEVTLAMRDYIDALPDEVVATLPAMPGFDRDWADNIIAEAKIHGISCGGEKKDD